jgi:hypothetical protein
MIERFDDAREIGGRDALDAELGPPPIGPVGRLAVLLRSRAALGLPPLVAPALVFVPLGVACGRYGLGLVGPDAAVWLDVVASIALAAIGVFVGLALDLRTRVDGRLFAAATVEAATTVLVVGGLLWFVFASWAPPLGLSPLVLASIFAVAAAASSAGFLDDERDPLARVATRIADLDDVVPILAGGVILAALARGDVAGTLGFWGLTIVLGLALAVAGWLLFDRAEGDAERGVLVAGTVVMLGGTAAYLGLSPLLTGLAAGLFWTYAPGRADTIIRADLRRLQHPLVVLLLIAAGVAWTADAGTLWLAAAYVLARTPAKLAGGLLASRLAPELAPADLGARLVPPGLIGIAFAFAVRLGVGDAVGDPLVAAITMGTLASELLAAFVLPAREGA